MELQDLYTKYREKTGIDHIRGEPIPDGKAQDVYIFGTDLPLERFEGTVIAVWHCFNDTEDKQNVSLKPVFQISKSTPLKK